MNAPAKGEYRSAVYTNRPPYADYDAPRKFMAIQSIIAKRLVEHPHAICSYSGGADSDILIDVIERTRAGFDLPPVKYVFFNTGLEMKATKDHVREVAEKYGVEIAVIRPKTGIVRATRQYGVPFMSKIFSQRFAEWYRHPEIPVTVAYEFAEATDKHAKRMELAERYPRCGAVVNWLCSCDSNGDVLGNQMAISNSRFMLDFIAQNPPTFKISARCCEMCKKRPAHETEQDYEMVITGERMQEGGQRTISWTGCFGETNGKYRLRPLYYVSDKDKAWYKDYYGIRYSDAYEVYGLTRTGCCGCHISYKAVDDLELIRPYEPNVVKAAWNIFGDSYRYRQQYNEYKAMRKAEEKRMAGEIKGQLSIADMQE